MIDKINPLTQALYYSFKLMFAISTNSAKKKMKMFTYKNLIRRNLKVPSFSPMGHKLIIKHSTAAQEVYI
jgi:hypothetical protein